MADQEGMSVADLVRQIQVEKKLTRNEIAAELGRSPRMVGKILNSETSGESYREALTSLSEKGSVDRRPPRRRDGQGNLVRVRAKIDQEHQPETVDGKVKAPTYIPEDTGGRWTKKAPNRFSTKSSYADNGDRIHSVTMHKSNKQSRERGIGAVMGNLRTVTRSQSHKDKRVNFTVTLDNGHVMSIGDKGGYFSSDVLRTITKDFGGDAHAYLVDQVSKVYKTDKVGGNITGLQMNVFDAKGQAWNTKKGRN